MVFKDSRSQKVILTGSTVFVFSFLFSLVLIIDQYTRLVSAQEFVNDAERIDIKEDQSVNLTSQVGSGTEKNYRTPTEPTVLIEKVNLPKKDPSLPSENRVRIEKLGADAPLQRSIESEESLKNGAWMPADFNTPPGKALVESSEPVIIASHLYGFAFWTDEFRRQVSFRGLEDLQQGDQIEVIWDQRRYVYQIVGSEVNTEISTYEHDLVLYTCNDLSGSDLRVIQYANLVEEQI